MPDIRSYLKQDVPRDIATQIRSGHRFVWPEVNAGWTKIESPPVKFPVERRTFVLVEDELLVSHAEANIRAVELGGVPYKVGGLSGVFTYPSHRGGGGAQRVVGAATEFLKSSPIDFALLFCGDRVKSLYDRTGWMQLPEAKIFYGDRENPTAKTDNFIMSLFVSEKAKAARASISTERMYVGVSTW